MDKKGLIYAALISTNESWDEKCCLGENLHYFDFHHFLEFFILIKFQELFHKMLICFQIKIGTLEGNLARLSYEDLLENPLLRFSGRNQVSNYGSLLSDLHSWHHLSASLRHF